MSEKPSRTACVQMVGPDYQMDYKNEKWDPANPLPIKCSYCTFPDLDYVAKPYLLGKGISSPAETSNASLGNFLVRDRVKRILELAVPGTCTFHPTADLKGKSSPWWLIVPKAKLKTIAPKPEAPFCPKCGEPRIWFSPMGPFWEKMKRFDSGGTDIFKTIEWMGSNVRSSPHPEQWPRYQMSRGLYFSVRLEQLFKRAKIKGQLVRLLNFSDVKTTPEDEAWFQSKLNSLADRGLIETPKAGASKNSASQKWFAQFLKHNAKKGVKAPDFAAVEKKHKLTLPRQYKDFISQVGPKSFADVCGMEGSTTTILSPQKLDFKSYRCGKVPYLEGDDAKVDGVMFASTDHGDCFVFDVSEKGNDFPVYWYQHEENVMEQFASNFAECVQRFVKKN